jgi:Zn-dependent metalloprotease
MCAQKKTRGPTSADESEKQAARKLRPKGYKSSNGLRNFSIHLFDKSDAAILAKLAEERAAFPAFSLAGPENVAQLDPETVAKWYLAQALQSPTVPSFTAPKPEAIPGAFKSLGTETVPLTGTRTVKFRQTLGQIPVYGSLVTVELDRANNLVSLNSSIGDLEGVGCVAKIAAADAVKAVEKYPGFQKQLTNIVPQLMYYFDKGASKWRLVFFLEDVPIASEEPRDQTKPAPQYMDYVVDADTGEVVAQLPRTSSMAATLEHAIDGRKQSRPIKVEISGAIRILQDTSVNVQTFDFGFDDPAVNSERLPGKVIDRPPAPWPPSAVSAHANAVVVAEFLRNVLGRNNIDNKGGPINSSINCVVSAESPDKKQWCNSLWSPDKKVAVFGQRLDDDGSLMSRSVNLDVVGHEIFHGVTASTARLEYAGESGALNESYSDIFGVVISNFDNPNTRTWNWKLGEGLNPEGKPDRDMEDPTRFGQPAHMQDFVQLSLKDDWGGVHTNSGIHNKAAFHILTSVDSAGELIFKPKEVAAMFYAALTQHLSRTSQFSDSRRYAINSALSLFGTLPPGQLAAKVNAIKKSFSAVGISE